MRKIYFLALLFVAIGVAACQCPPHCPTTTLEPQTVSELCQWETVNVANCERTLLTTPPAWQATPVATGVYTNPDTNEQKSATLRQITGVNQIAIPSRAITQGLDLLMIASPEQKYNNNTAFTNDLKLIMANVFATTNPLSVNEQAFSAPFQYYYINPTDYHYPQITPVSADRCNPGLPENWAPAGNTTNADQPAWNCNIALSTAPGGIHLDLGFVVHVEQEQDRSKFNIFSSEYNSYATIIHELSHSAFALSDEVGGGDARFPLVKYANVFESGKCNAICPACCAEIMKDGISEAKARCIAPSAAQEPYNLMYFYPAPTPGSNETWACYRYSPRSIQRRKYIYDKCQNGEC